jgi:mRNA-degrading endonuclease YafQ of YafQ-DinJ toxin-antitoxin module
MPLPVNEQNYDISTYVVIDIRCRSIRPMKVTDRTYETLLTNGNRKQATKKTVRNDDLSSLVNNVESTTKYVEIKVLYGPWEKMKECTIKIDIFIYK